MQVFFCAQEWFPELLVGSRCNMWGCLPWCYANFGITSWVLIMLCQLISIVMEWYTAICSLACSHSCSHLNKWLQEKLQVWLQAWLQLLLPCCWHDILPSDVGSQACSQACSCSCSHLHKYKWLQAQLQAQLQIAVYFFITIRHLMRKPMMFSITILTCNGKTSWVAMIFCQSWQNIMGTHDVMPTLV